MKTIILFVTIFSSVSLACRAQSTASASPTNAVPMKQDTTAMFANTSWSPKVKTILAKSKAAMGGAAWDHIYSLRIKGTISVAGSSLSGTTKSLMDLHTGRYVTFNNFGSLQTAKGYNGHTGWLKSPTRVISYKGKPRLMKTAVTSAYQTEKAWWYPKRWPAEIKALGKKQDSGVSFQVLRITPKGGSPFQLWINAKTHFIARFVSHAGAATTYLSDYRSVAGVNIALHRRITAGNRKIIKHYKRVTTNVRISAENFDIPKADPNNFSLAGDADRVTVPFKLVPFHGAGAWIYVNVTVNGHPMHFVLDSNAGNFSVLTPDAAKAIDLNVTRSHKRHIGAGAKASKIGFTNVKSLVIGGKVSILNQPFIVLHLPKIPGYPVDGLIGGTVLQHFVVQIDYANHKLTFIRPNTFDPSKAGTVVPLKFTRGGSPTVEGSIDGLSGRFVVDTGYGIAPLTIHSPFAKAHHLYTRYHATPPVPVGSGVGGALMARIARGDTLTIGGVAVSNPVINLSLATKGAFASKLFAGNIGGQILKRFTVTFDFPHKRMYLKPNQFYGKRMDSPFLNRAGLRFKKSGRGFSITWVMKGGPAAQTGVKKGDLITAVNEEPAYNINPDTFRKMLRNEAPGTKVELTIGKGTATHTVTITLQRLIPKTGGLNSVKQ